MSSIPYELSDEARIWVHRTLHALENPDSSMASAGDWVPPSNPIWAIWVAEDLAENWGTRESFLASRFRNGTSVLLQNIAQWLRQAVTQEQVDLDEAERELQLLVIVQVATSLYLRVRQSVWKKLDGAFLQIAFASGSGRAIQMGVDLLLQYPPDIWTSASVALSPLMQYRSWNPEAVFPKILDSQNPSILASALDIANNFFIHLPEDSPVPGQYRAERHPVFKRITELTHLLGSLVHRLGALEDNPAKFGTTPEEIQQILFDSVSLTVSLCHTMALCQAKEAIGKLMQAAALRHRRIQTEASFALACLGVEQGVDQIIELAADPTSRQRAVAYAEELGFADRIAEIYKTSLAIAESQLCQWLASVEQMGVAPSKIELVEQRTLPWPGYESPQETFLFRYQYGLAQSEYSNIGVSGPTCKAFPQDLANVSSDDAYEIFAGWDIDHPEIFEKSPSKLSTSESQLIDQWEQQLTANAFQKIEIRFVASFFGKNAIVGFGYHDERKQCFVFDGDELIVPTSLPSTDETLSLAYYQWRGREFFQNFNV